MEHTPGPWRVASDGDLGLDLIWTETENEPGILIARTCFAPASLPNARLIAAAPDLYMAAAAFVDAMARGEVFVASIDDAHEQHLRNLCAALRKARGETV